MTPFSTSHAALTPIVLALLGAPNSSQAMNVAWTIDVQFKTATIAVSDTQREKLLSYVSHIRELDPCPLEVVILKGSASSAEGSPETLRSLAQSRAHSVAVLLAEYGVPKERLYEETSPPLHSDSSHAVVALEFVGPHLDDCKLEKNAAGFRVFPMPVAPPAKASVK